MNLFDFLEEEKEAHTPRRTEEETAAVNTEDSPEPPLYDGLRTWQKHAIARYFEEDSQDFLAVATPGAGKTTFALRLAGELLRTRTVDRLIVVVPTEHLKNQWSEAAAAVGISLDPSFKNDGGVINPHYHGIIVTYAQVSMHPYKHYHIAAAQHSLVILDEIHHAGDAKSWGEGIDIAYSDATRRLALTGTPFRSDDAQIPFVRYVDDGEGHAVSQSDYAYGYAEALADGVVRPVIFLAYSGEARWRDNAGEEYSARLGEPLTPEQTTRAWRTALDPHGEWIPTVLRAAHSRLCRLRESIPDAGGLIIATDKIMARAYARIMEQLSGESATVVLSDDTGASEKIAEFSRGTTQWLIAVRMVSEGVDVPRLAVGVYATSASTPLFFAQAIGRFVRSRRKGETASIFLPSVPVLLELASTLEVSRDHVLGKPDRSKNGWDDELVAQANATQTEPDCEKSYEILGSEAELDALIYDGSTYGTETLAASAEEEEYLGLPGLLDGEQMRELLHKRRTEQLHTHNKNARVTEEKSAEQNNAQHKDPPVASVLIPALRKQLNMLVSLTSSRTGKPHAAIHAELRAHCGGPPVASCTAQQLQDRIAYLRKW